MTQGAKILTVSTSVSAGSRTDVSGQDLTKVLTHHGFEIREVRVVSDGIAPVAEAISELATDFAGLLITTGGTGFSPTDLTPEATLAVVDRQAPGLAELMRAASPLGGLSRGIAGTIGRCLVLNVPGSPKGATESFEAVASLVPHALELLAGHHPH